MAEFYKSKEDDTLKEYDKILNNLTNKIYHPVYLLTGEESYYIDQISDYIEKNILTPDEKEFNQSVYYGLETDVLSIINAAKRFPMMSNYQVIVVKEAQHLKKIEELQRYCENPLKSTILVIDYKYKKLDGRTKFYKAIQSKGIIFTSNKIKDYKLADWISKYITSVNLKADSQASQLLADHLGNDLNKITNEIGKLAINLKPGTSITLKDIEDNIGISKDFNAYELQNAIMRRDTFKAFQIVNYFNSNPRENPIQVNLITIYNLFTKLLIYQGLKVKDDKTVAVACNVNIAFVKDYHAAAKYYNIQRLFKIFEEIKNIDLRSKGIDNVSATHGELLKELVFKIMH